MVELRLGFPFRLPKSLPTGPCFRRVKSNFRMAESKIGMLLMHVYNKIALSLGGGDAIL
jgi:hypothetical protein